MAGRPRKSADVVKSKMSKAEKEARKEAEASIAFEGEIIAPDFLDKTAMKYFNYLKPQLEQNGMLHPPDAFHFGMLCQNMSEYVAALTVLRKDGKTFKFYDRQGNEVDKLRAEYKVMRDCEQVISQLGAKFGITPAERLKLLNTPPEEKEESAIDKLIRMRASSQ